MSLFPTFTPLPRPSPFLLDVDASKPFLPWLSEIGRNCIPQQGELLRLLARGRSGGVIGETGTGHGVGLAWMLSGVDASTRLVSVERDPGRAAACAELFAQFPNVTVLTGDWQRILGFAPFDLLVLDGGGGGKNGEAVSVERALRPGGTLVLDDMVPTHDADPNDDTFGEHGHRVRKARAYWLSRPEVLVTEGKLTRVGSTLIATLRMPQN